MNDEDKQSALLAITILRKHFVPQQRGQQLLTQIEEIIMQEKTNEGKEPAIETNVPPKKRRGRPRKGDKPTRKS